MKQDNNIQKEINNLVVLALDSKLSSEQANRLNELLIHSPEGVDYYLECLSVQLGLQHIKIPTGSIPAIIEAKEAGIAEKALDKYNKEEIDSCSVKTPDDSSAFWEVVDEDISRITSQLPEVKPDATDSSGKLRRQKAPPRFPGKMLAVIAALIMFAVLLNILAEWGQYTSPDKSVVARLTDSIDAEWAQNDNFEVGALLFDGYLVLERGHAGITFRDGTYVILEGPAAFSLLGEDEMFLDRGKLTAKMGEGSIRFTVNTYNTAIMDVGTEFGVMADGMNNTDVHVFDGEVILYPGDESGRFNKAKGIHVYKDQARRVDRSRNVEKIAMRQTEFARSLSPESGFVWNGKNIDLADVVGGGSGFGDGKINYGVRMTSGKYAEIISTHPATQCSKAYMPVPELEYIDGVFVPDGEDGPIQITSTDIKFDSPDTSGTVYGGVFNGAWVDNVDIEKHYLKLNGVEYNPSESAICMHSNKGITFDLDAIRRKTPSVAIKRFSASCGISSTVLEIWNKTSRVDFWVMVDGREGFTKRMQPEDGAARFTVDINDNDRFLTLIVTDGGYFPDKNSSTGRDWALFTEPTLELEAR